MEPYGALWSLMQPSRNALKRLSWPPRAWEVPQPTLSPIADINNQLSSAKLSRTFAQVRNASEDRLGDEGILGPGLFRAGPRARAKGAGGVARSEVLGSHL